MSEPTDAEMLQARSLCDALNKHHYPATMSGKPPCVSCTVILQTLAAVRTGERLACIRELQEQGFGTAAFMLGELQ